MYLEDNGEKEFCFYDTVKCNFIEIGGSYVFDSIKDLEDAYKSSVCEFELERLIRLTKGQ